jgi:hypothetical protein
VSLVQWQSAEAIYTMLLQYTAQYEGRVRTQKKDTRLSNRASLDCQSILEEKVSIRLQGPLLLQTADCKCATVFYKIGRRVAPVLPDKILIVSLNTVTRIPNSWRVTYELVSTVYLSSATCRNITIFLRWSHKNLVHLSQVILQARRSVRLEVHISPDIDTYHWRMF